MEQLLAGIASATGFPLDQVKYVICMFTMILVAPIFRSLPGATAKHLFSIVLSVAACIFCLGPWAWLHSFGTALMVYLLMIIIPSYCHILTYLLCFGYLSASHIYRQYTDYMGWTMDFTGPQMVVTLKLVSIAFCFHDGLRPDAELSPSQKKKLIKGVPSPLEFFGFVYFYCSFLAGPTIEISEYREYISGKQFQDKYCNGRIPSTLLPTLKVVARALLCMGLIVSLGPYFSSAALLSPSLVSREGPLWTAARIYITPPLVRCKYYFGWSLAEASFVACGFGYNGLGVEWEDPASPAPPTAGEKKPRWDRVSNVLIRKVELGQNIRDMTTYWNYRTGEFLRYYVYERVPKVTGRSPLAAVQRVLLNPTLDVFVTSAFWHGFYPGYYVFFVHLSILVIAARDVRRVIRPMFLQPAAAKAFYDVLTWFATISFADYAGVAFLLMSWENIAAWYGQVYWYAHVAAVLGFVVMKVVLAIRPPASSSSSRARPVKAE